MIPFLVANAAIIGQGIVAASVMAGAAWIWLQKAGGERAKGRADVAIAESQREVFEQMKERLTSQEAHLQRLQIEVDDLRMQIRVRDRKIHVLEMYVSDLQHILHEHGIEIPPMK